jgi:hypothetical protein
MFRRFWVTACNLLFVGFVSFGLLDDYRFYQLSGPAKPPHAFLHALGSLLLIVLLSLGIVSEWLDWIWIAALINSGYFAFLGFGVLGKAALMVMTKPPAEYDPEGGLTVAIVGIPCAAIALADFLLYWFTRPRRAASPIG